MTKNSKTCVTADGGKTCKFSGFFFFLARKLLGSCETEEKRLFLEPVTWIGKVVRKS
jgi:hypothetical protein